MPAGSEDIGAFTASRISRISSGSVTGHVAKPIAVADNSTRLVASPAKLGRSARPSAVPRASTIALSGDRSASADRMSTPHRRTTTRRDRRGRIDNRGIAHRDTAGIHAQRAAVTSCIAEHRPATTSFNRGEDRSDAASPHPRGAPLPSKCRLRDGAMNCSACDRSGALDRSPRE